MMAKVTISKSHVKTWLSGSWKADPAKPGVQVSAKGVISKKLTAKSGKTFEGKLFLEDNPASEYGPDYRLVLPESKKRPEQIAAESGKPGR